MLFFKIFFVCVLLKGDISKNMRLFTKAIFRGLVRFVKSSLHVDIGLKGQLVYIPLLHILYPVTSCFTIHTNLLRVNSKIYQSILPIFFADI